jgi:beta-glucanase (GH16 family)
MPLAQTVLLKLIKASSTGDDPFWEAVDLWYGATADLEWYDPQQITTRDGNLVITMDSTSTAQAGLTPGESYSSYFLHHTDRM